MSLEFMGKPDEFGIGFLGEIKRQNIKIAVRGTGLKPKIDFAVQNKSLSSELQYANSIGI